jgi:hypothetical protein
MQADEFQFTAAAASYQQLHLQLHFQLHLQLHLQLHRINSCDDEFRHGLVLINQASTENLVFAQTLILAFEILHCGLFDSKNNGGRKVNTLA